MKKLIFAVTTGLLISNANANTGGFTVQQGSFKDLFNGVRVGQPEVVPWAGSFFPYAHGGTSVKVNPAGLLGGDGRSPMETYEKLIGVTGADAWEKANHACDHLPATEQASCRGWWGHCNGWSAAAVKEVEPRRELRLGNHTLSVADQKGILSELWLNTYSISAGESDKSRPVGDWVHNHASPTVEYRRFWDVTPRAFFTVFTNTIGLMKMGVVIDRFAGDQVWNQPVVGYRILPIRAADIKKVSYGDLSYWSVLVRAKIYWANDLGTPPGHVSAPFDVFRMTQDTETVEDLPRSGTNPDYEGRFLSFRLMFDGPVEVSPDGLKVLEAGQILGDGIWTHQEMSQKYSGSQLNQTHPDFIWLPTNPIAESNGYGNPHVTSVGVSPIRTKMKPNTSSAPGQVPGPPGPMKAVKLILDPRMFALSERNPEKIKGQMKYIFRREGIRHEISTQEIVITPDRIVVPVRFPEGFDRDAVSSLFRSARYSVNFEL